MQPIRPPSKELLERMACLHSMPPSNMTGDQARAQVAFQGLITLSGGEGDDAKTYQERQVTKAIADSKSGE